MQIRCSNCGAVLRSGETPPDGQFPAKCWMCMSAVTPRKTVAKPAPPTVLSQSGKSTERHSALRLGRESASEARSLEIPVGQSIKICVVAGISRGMEFELSRPVMTIGRVGGKADIQIDDPEVSRLHCSVEVRRDAIILHDLRSTNGTFVGDSRVLSARLKKMSQFRIGSSYLRIDILSSNKQRSKT